MHVAMFFIIYNFYIFFAGFISAEKKKVFVKIWTFMAV